MNILISSCLLGEDVRYDGENSAVAYNNDLTYIQKELFTEILCNNNIYAICPEVSGGLSTPRNKAEIVSRDKPFKITTEENEDVTINFLVGAKNSLDLCNSEKIDVALLKSKSPSCGNFEIYDGTFNGKLVKGKGMTTKLLEENQIKVFNETEIIELAKYLNMTIPTNKINLKF
jgi:uncharacterized protein YbbK (DUF523 family)